MPTFEQLETRITPVVINNGLATTTVGFFSANVQNAGVVSTAPGTYQGQSGTIFTNVNFIYQYKPFIQTTTSPTSIQLASTTIDSPVASTGPNSTSSSGHFTGSGGNQINWTVASTLAPNSTELISTTTFTATTGTLGSLRFVSYLDEDVAAGNGAGDDLLNPRNTPGTNAFVVGYFDGPQRIGFAQGGTQEAGTGLQKATYIGWAGGTYNGVETRITNKTQTFSVAGVIGDSLVKSNDPKLGTIYGPADVGSAMAWNALATATSAVITTRLVQFSKDAALAVKLTATKVKLLYPLQFYSLGSGLVQGTFTLVNVSGAPIAGPIRLSFPKLPPGVSVKSATIIASLAKGQAARIVVVFNNPLNAYLGNLQFKFPADVLAGGGV